MSKITNVCKLLKRFLAFCIS